MALRINHNISALNGHRQLAVNDKLLSKSLEKLSSGMKVNRAADGPATLIISEQMRAQVAGLNQAVDNAETAIGMVQTTEAALTEVTSLLTNMRQLAIHAANEGANDQNMLEADQLELNNALDTVDRLTRSASFGAKTLLDGSQGANGVAMGEGLEFVGAGPKTRSSPVEGFAVQVHKLGAQAHIEGNVGLTQEMVDNGEEITITEDGKTVSFIAKKGDSVDQTIGKLRNEIKENGLNVELMVDENNVMSLKHKEYGSEYTFSVSSSTAGVLSSQARVMEAATAGQDIMGTIGGEVAVGKGQKLTGAQGTKAEGLTVRYKGTTVTPEGSDDTADRAGNVAVYQNSMVFQVGANVGQTVSVSMVNTNTRVLGRGISNDSGFRSLRDLDIRNAQGAEDAQRLIDRSIDEVNVTRAELGAFQKNTLESNLRQLRISAEELTNAESVIRDADMAKEVADFTRNSIMVQSSTAMLAQANSMPRAILRLLD